MIKNKNKIWFCLLFMCAIKTTLQAQQEAQFTQYMYNTMSINPAYAGSREMLSVLGLYRTQWVGLDGAPKTVNFNVDSPIGNGVGLGVSVINDKIGPSDENNINFDISYNTPLSDEYRIYYGIKASANILNVDFTKLKYYDVNDPQFENNIDNRFSPNFGAGVYLKSNNAYAGVSVPYMLETKHYNHSQFSTANERMHIYLMGGYVFNVSNNLKFRPAFLTKILKGAPIQFDLSANFIYNEKFTLGAAYRLSSAVSLLAGFQVSDNIFVGYSYDTDTSKLGNYNSGSHEIILRFDIFDFSSDRAFSPRFF